jgi:hypothetical protein
MTNTTASGFLPGPRAFIIAGSVLALVLIAAFAWQVSVRSSRNDSADRHNQVVSVITSAKTDGVAAGELLRKYVETGDETILPEMREKTDSGVRQLTNALSVAGEDPNGFVQQGGAFVQAAGRIVALRQAGDVQGAVTALTQLSGEFDAFVNAQDTFIAAEQAKAAQAQSEAEDAETAAFWIAIAIAADMIAVLCALAVLVVRRSARGTQAAAA